MNTRPNRVFYAAISAAFLLVAAVFVLAGTIRKRRRQRKAWLMEAGGSQ